MTDHRLVVNLKPGFRKSGKQSLDEARREEVKKDCHLIECMSDIQYRMM